MKTMDRYHLYKYEVCAIVEDSHQRKINLAHIVKFRDYVTFTGQLAEERKLGTIHPPVVRLALLVLPTNVPEITNVVAVATARMGKDIFRMEESCGARWGVMDYSDTHDRFAQIREEIEGVCQDLGLRLCGGMFEEA